MLTINMFYPTVLHNRRPERLLDIHLQDSASKVEGLKEIQLTMSYSHGKSAIRN